jgi:hypothetical protein
MLADLSAMLPGGVGNVKDELGQLSARFATRTPGTRSEAKKMLEPVYELTFDNGATDRRPVRRITRQQVILFAVSIAGFSLLGGMLLGSWVVTRRAAVFYRDSLGINGLVGALGLAEEDSRMGELEVHSVPSGVVEVDGREYGMTPLRIRVDPGQRLLVVRAHDGDDALEARVFVVIRSQGITSRRFEALKGRLWDDIELERRRVAGAFPFGSKEP